MNSRLIRSTLLTFGAIGLLVLAGCQHGYGPVVANGYAEPITITAVFADRREHAVQLMPGNAFWQGRDSQHLTALAVTRAGKTLRYGQAALQRLRRSYLVPDELWIVGERGLMLEDLRDIQRIRRQLPK